MNINDFVTANAAMRYGRSAAASKISSTQNTAANAGLQKAEKRIQALADSNTVQLSSVGKLKSALAATQSTAASAANMATNSTPANVKSAAGKLVSAFNASMSAAMASSSLSGDNAVGSNAARVGKDLVRAISSDAAGVEALKGLGFSLSSDGTLSLDNKKWDAAQQSNPADAMGALKKLAQQLGSAATQALAADGNVGRSISSLNQRSALLERQQNTLAALYQNTSPSQVYGSY
jgi:hypothetical protein